MNSEGILYIVIVGDVVDGLDHYGPFEDPNEAGEWACNEFKDENHIVAPLWDPYSIND